MASDLLKVPKKLKKVTLWVHPEGRVVGSLFLHKQSLNHVGEQNPIEILNQNQAFLVLRRDDPDEVRFYNRASIIRVEYTPGDEEALPEVRPFPCRLHMMDGSMITGTIREPLPPDQARLYDYLNKAQDRFIKISVDADSVYLVNKAYIIHATDLEDNARPDRVDS